MRYQLPSACTTVCTIIYIIASADGTTDTCRIEWSNVQRSIMLGVGEERLACTLCLCLLLVLRTLGVVVCWGRFS